MRRLIALCVVLLATTCIALSNSTSTVKAENVKATCPGVPKAIKFYRASTWHWQDKLGKRRTVASKNQALRSCEYGRWKVRLWKQRAQTHRELYKKHGAVIVRLNRGLAGTPLAGYGNVFAKEGREHNVSPFMVASIAGKESSFGVAMCMHNPFGWSPFCQFNTFEQAIATVTEGLRNNYLSKGRMSVEAIGAIYCIPPYPWITDVKRFMQDRFGASPKVTYY